LKKNELYCFYRPAVIDEIGEKYGCMSGVISLERFSAGFSYISLAVSGIEKTGVGDYEDFIMLGEFEDKESAFFLSIGGELFKDLSYLGINVKWIKHTLNEETGKGFGVDIGYLTNLSKSWDLRGLFREVKFGAVIRYMGDKKWDSGHKDPGSIEKELGLTWVLVPKDNENFKWTLTGSIKRIKDKPIKLSLGTELFLWEYIALRAGYNKDKKFTFGCRLNFRLNAKEFNLDYAVASSSSRRKFDCEQQISFGCKFGRR
jgi:hypothetical protein